MSAAIAVRWTSPYFGEGAILGRARTARGLARLLAAHPAGGGWGPQIEGTAAALAALGACRTEACWVLRLGCGDYLATET